jgi:superfamily I DNA/RNA helicase
LRSSIDDPPVLDEEVRLFYVAITLAKHLLDASSELIQM